MNNSFYGNDNFSSPMPNVPNYDDFLNTANNTTLTPNTPNMGNWNNTTITNSYAQGVLKKNIGMTGYFFVSFPDSVDWRDKIFYGILTDAGDDYLLIYNEENNEYYLVWSIYLNYATFDRRPNTN
jgi:spore germination protein Q